MLIQKKLDEYKSLLDFEDDYFGKTFSSNFKFIEKSVKKFRKGNEKEDEIIQFIQDTIDIHKRNYNRELI